MKNFCIACGLIASISWPASSHVRFEEATAPAGSYALTGLLVPHGCGDSPTTAISLKIADGVSQVTPQQVPGWDVSITKRTLDTPIILRGFEVYETVDTVIWSGGNLPSFAFQRFEVHIKTPENAGSHLYFPVVQTCETGESHWVNIPEAGKENQPVAEPAPTLKLVPATKVTAH